MSAIDEYFRKTLKSCSTFLGRWKGARVELFDLRRGHKILSVLLTVPGREGNLLLACLEPEIIHAPVVWSDSDLVVTSVELPNSKEQGFLVSDEAHAAQIYCAALEVKENVRLE